MSLRNKVAALVFALLVSLQLAGQDTAIVVNDISQLNPIKVGGVIRPTEAKEISDAIRAHSGSISIGGGRYSMGGQIAAENSLHIDMRSFDSILYFSKENKLITVQSGITWRKVQEFIDPYDLSVKIMQTYANFTVGGSLGVNAHGRYIGLGPIVQSVREIRVILASGETVLASPVENPEIFYGVIGGYGGLGVITEVTLELTDNVKVQRNDRLLSIREYDSYFFQHVLTDSLVVFHNADIYPGRYRKVRAISYTKTDRAVTVKDRLKPENKIYRGNRFAFQVISEIPGGKWARQHLLDHIIYAGKPVEWRNYEASYDVLELEPKNRKESTYVLQEYFVPVEQFDKFYPLLTEILRSNKVNVINISIRHSKKDPGTLQAWANSEVFAFVIYYKQGTAQAARDEVKKWTQDLINAAISCNGTYYLPYQIYATQDQFFTAYPNAKKYIELKSVLDPTNKFRNKLWDAYYGYN